MNPYEAAKKLVDAFNKAPDRYDKDQSEAISKIAGRYGLEFKPKTKKLEKFAFDAADTALIGLIPNRLRPKTAGEDIFGESFGEELAGGAGTLLGLIPPVALGARAIGAGAKALKGLAGKGGAGIKTKMGDLASKAIPSEAARERAGMALGTVAQIGSRTMEAGVNIGSYAINTIRMQIIKLKGILASKQLSEKARMNVINQLQRLINKLPQRFRRT